MGTSNSDLDPLSSAWIQAARDRFGRAGEYPLIDDGEIIEHAVLFDFWPWPPAWRRHSIEQLRQEALTSDHYDAPVRFVYLNLFFRLAHYNVENFDVYFEDREDAAWHREQFLDFLQTLVCLVDPNRCEDARTVRWEIVNACSVRHWVRVRQLYDRLEALGGMNNLPEFWRNGGSRNF